MLPGLGTGNGLAVNTACFLGKPADKGRGIIDLTAGFHQGLALLQRHQAGNVFAVLEHQVVPAHQQVSTFQRRGLAPTGKGLVGLGNAIVELSFAQAGHAADNLAAGRVIHLDGGAIAGVDPVTCDQTLLAKQAGFGKTGRCRHSGLLGQDDVGAGRPCSTEKRYAVLCAKDAPRAAWRRYNRQGTVSVDRAPVSVFPHGQHPPPQGRQDKQQTQTASGV